MNVKTDAGENLSMKIMKINPSIARELLGTRRRNRSVQRGRVRRYCEGMKLGEWVVAQPILLDADGNLIDGQHRLHAVIESKQQIEFLVVKGFDYENVFCRLDDVAKRTLRDWLQMEGINNPKIVAAVVFWAARDLRGLVPCGRGAAFVQTPIEGLEFLEEHPEIHESITAPGVFNTYIPWAMSAFCHWKFTRHTSRTVADSFFIDLVMTDVMSEGDPVYLLRERLKSDKKAKTKLKKTEKLALIYKAFNAAYENRKLRTLQWRTAGPTPESFPEVVCGD